MIPFVNIPLYMVGFFLLLTLIASLICHGGPLVLALSSSAVVWLWLLCLGFGLFIFAIFIHFKLKINTYFEQINYLKYREKINRSQKLKEALYDATMISATGLFGSQSHSVLLERLVEKVEESISFLNDGMPLYTEDFQSIINKLHDWVAYFNKQEKMKRHALLKPTKISLEKLMDKLEFALSKEVAHPPRLLVEKIDDAKGPLSPYIICYVNQVVSALVQAVLRVSSKLDVATWNMVDIQLHNTCLQFKRTDPIDDSYPPFMSFQAIGIVISHAELSAKAVPKVKPFYSDIMNNIENQYNNTISLSIDLERDMVSSMVHAHYGYLEYPVNSHEQGMLLVLPIDVTKVRDKMLVQLPIDYLTTETAVTPKEEADSMMALIQFHDYFCQSSHEVGPIDASMTSNLLLLLKQRFGFKRHGSGQLFYVRAVGIAQLVVRWVFHSPKVIYESLLYELVRQTYLPLSYIKEHYNLGVYAFVLNLLKIDQRQELDHSSLLYVRNRLKQAIKQDHIQLSVLFIKLAERLYDLRHAEGYSMLEEVKYMANETLMVDVELAKQYLAPEIAEALATAAQQALKVYNRKKIDKLPL